VKTKNRIIIAALLIIVIASVIGFEITCNSDAKNIYIGIFSSSIVVLLLEIIAFFRDRYKYSFLDGIYQRQIITDKQILPINDSIYKDMTQSYKDDNVPDKIKLVYSGDGEYKGTAEYNEGKVEIVINLNADNRNVGTGTYQFTSKKLKLTKPMKILFTFITPIRYQVELPVVTKYGKESERKII